jgi:protein TonB
MLAFHDSAIWGAIRQQPLVRMLLLSLSLHAAVIMLVQPRSYSVPREAVVINARLVEAKPLSSPDTENALVVPLKQSNASAKPPEPVPPTHSPAVSLSSIVATSSSASQPTVMGVKPISKVTESNEEVVSPPASVPASLPSIPVMVDPNWYDSRQLDVQPRASQPINPVYPADAVRRNQPGSVKLKLKIDEFGVVKDAEVEEGNPPGVFDDSALAAFKMAHFEPARKNGRAVRALIYIRVRYELNDL